MGTYKEELHSNYQKSVQAFIHVYPHILPDTITLIDNYCRTCAMYLWNSFSIDINTCMECINVIFAEDNKKKTFTANQVKAAMSKLSERQYSMPVPAFFKKIIENDLKDETNYSRKLASCFGLVFITFALIDGTVEYEEAKIITELHGDLVKACDDRHIIDTLLKEMEDHRGDFAVIVAGYDDLMKQFIESNPGLKSRFNKFIHFEDYTSEEMIDIFNALCEKNAYTVTDDAGEIIKQYFATICETHDESFANARTARNFFENVISKQASRIASKKEKTKEILSTITVDDVSWCQDSGHEEETLEDILATFNELTGLDLVKEEISDLVYVVQHQQRRKAQGLKVPSLSLHLVFMGNPGTGKTTVARYVAKLYKSLGLLSKGHLVETDRSGLVAGYVGQTAIKTQEVINSALGGVLFIDETYTLSNGGANDFGQEAIDTLLKAMEDKRDDLVVIVAGYDELMDDFVHSNPGLESRFNRYIHFSDYSIDEMYCIFSSLCQKNQYELSVEATTAVKDYFSSISIADIGNGRGARNLFEKVVTQQAKRISKSSDNSCQELSVITETDVVKAVKKG